MTTLTIPDIDPQTERWLRARSIRTGRSIEEEARRALADQVVNEVPVEGSSRESALEFIQRLKAKHGGGGDIPIFDRTEWKDRPVDFGE